MCPKIFSTGRHWRLGDIDAYPITDHSVADGTYRLKSNTYWIDVRYGSDTCSVPENAIVGHTFNDGKLIRK